MELVDACRWLEQSDRRGLILDQITQPLTATQLSRRTQIDRDGVSHVLTLFGVHRLTRCLNASARENRLFWLTASGAACQDERRRAVEQSPRPRFFPSIDWTLYGAVCYRHRSAVVKALIEPLQPSAIKRIARKQNEAIRMSANNVRGVVRFLVTHGIVEPVLVRRFKRKRYRLTAVGEAFRTLLSRAEVPQ